MSAGRNTVADVGTGLDVEAWIEHGRAVVEVAGECDVYTAPRLRRALEELPAPARHRVVVEMSWLDFMDSTGLGALVGAYKRARTAAGRWRWSGRLSGFCASCGSRA